MSHVSNDDWGFDFFLDHGRLRLAVTTGLNGHVFYWDAQHTALPTDRWTLVAVTAA